MVSFSQILILSLVLFFISILIILVVLIIWWIRIRNIQKRAPKVDNYDDLKKINLDKDYIERRSFENVRSKQNEGTAFEGTAGTGQQSESEERAEILRRIREKRRELGIQE